MISYVYDARVIFDKFHDALENLGFLVTGNRLFSCAGYRVPIYTNDRANVVINYSRKRMDELNDFTVACKGENIFIEIEHDEKLMDGFNKIINTLIEKNNFISKVYDLTDAQTKKDFSMCLKHYIAKVWCPNSDWRDTSHIEDAAASNPFAAYYFFRHQKYCLDKDSPSDREGYKVLLAKMEMNDKCEAIPGYFLLMASLYASKLQEWKKAFELTKKAEGMARFCPFPYFYKGLLLFESARYERTQEMIGYFKEALVHNPVSINTLFKLARCYEHIVKDPVRAMHTHHRVLNALETMYNDDCMADVQLEMYYHSLYYLMKWYDERNLNGRALEFARRLQPVMEEDMPNSGSPLAYAFKKQGIEGYMQANIETYEKKKMAQAY
jgi:tetratricopeptide (TPR) repeat protein